MEVPETDDVHVWSVRLDSAELDRDIARVLSADELARAQRFRFARDQQAFARARTHLRTILGNYLRLDPARLEFTYGEAGKPRLAVPPGDGGLDFNLSHSHDGALVALTVGRVGVDLEYVRPFRDLHGVAADIFSSRELSAFQELSADQQDAAFFNAWTRKEAFVKATGLGFTTSVDEVEVSFAPGEPATLVKLHGDALQAASWTLQDVAVWSDYVAAVAVPGLIHTLKLFAQ